VKVFDEQQIFRIDHYLAKDTVQNVLASGSPTLSLSRYESQPRGDDPDHHGGEEGIGKRAGYYDQTGAVRDIIQNHMLQLRPSSRWSRPHLRRRVRRRAKARSPRAMCRSVPNSAVEGSTPATSTRSRRERLTSRTYAAPLVDRELALDASRLLRIRKALQRRVTGGVIKLRDAPHLRIGGTGSVASVTDSHPHPA